MDPYGSLSPAVHSVFDISVPVSTSRVETDPADIYLKC